MSVHRMGQACAWAGILTALAAFSGCDAQDTYNTQAAQQNAQAADAKMAALQPAVGNYCGMMHMIRSDLDFNFNLSLQIVEDNEHSSDSTDPTNTVQVPKLAGSMSFPAITNQGSAAYSTLPGLMQATGGSDAVSFTYGDYNPVDQLINLPFSIPGFTQGGYGAVDGKLDGNEFDGQWFSESSQLVGTFTAAKCATSSTTSSGGSS